MEETEEDREQNKLYRSAAFLCHLLRLGHGNMTRTSTILRTGILMLFTSLIFYFVGFVSPYWVEGEKHQFKHDPSGKRLADTVTDGHSTSLFDDNNTHFGLWEECVVVQDHSVCTIFTEDIDSVILMFGCVGGFLLFGLCCWSCLSCLRKPKKGRYYLIVISALIGGFFGFVCIFIFTAVQGAKHYSWAFAFFLSGCVLELCAAVVFLWGVRRATAQGFFPPALPDSEDPSPHTLPTIIVTGPTPTRKGHPKSVRVLQRSPKTKTSARRHQHHLEDHVDFISLDMVRPVPSLPSAGKRKRKKRKRTRKADDGSGDIQEESAVQSRAMQVAKHHSSYVDLASSASPPRPSADSKLEESASDAHRPLLYTFQSTADSNQDLRPTSVYTDLTGSRPKAITSRRRLSDVSERQRKTSRELKVCQKFTYRQAHSEDKPKRAARTSIRLSVDVHRSDDMIRDFEEDPVSEHISTSSHIKSDDGETLQLKPPSRVQFTPPIQGRQYSRKGKDKSAATPSPPTLGSKDLCLPNMVLEQSGTTMTQNGEREENQYVSYSPDTYHITTSFYTFQKDPSVV